jgi:hypothetical protein
VDDDEDPYSLLLNATQADMLRILAIYPDGSPEGLDALRAASTLLGEQYGAAGYRDLSEQMAADLLEMAGMLARIERRPVLEFLDEWEHDEPPPSVE